MITIFFKKIIPSRNHHIFFFNMSTSAGIDRDIERVIAADFIYLRHSGFDFTQYDELHKIDPRKVNIQDSFGNTALHICVIAGSDKTAALLLSLGADVNLTNAKGVSPISLFDTLRKPLYKDQESMQLLFQRYGTKEGLSLDESKDKKKTLEELKQKTEPLCKLIKEVLDSPDIRVPSEDERTANMKHMTDRRDFSSVRYEWNRNIGRLMKVQDFRHIHPARYGRAANMERMTEIRESPSTGYAANMEGIMGLQRSRDDYSARFMATKKTLKINALQSTGEKSDEKPDASKMEDLD
jgi:Ankyrin repeat